MAFDTFLELTGIEGEATAKDMAKKIEIYSFSWGASNPTTVGSGGTGLSAGKVSVSSFNIMKKTEKSSATLFAYVSPAGSVFHRLLDKYFRCRPDGETLRLLVAAPEAG